MGKYNPRTVFEFSTLKVGNLKRFSSDEMKTTQQTNKNGAGIFSD
ncbi:MAG TPA: hypothetical protein VL053_18855 [Arachidicoccus sp.]|nr:hypothetical protein [Arachidicoccus sp.]